MRVRPAAECAAIFQFTNHNPYPVVIDFRGVGYSTDGSAMPYKYSGSVRVGAGQSVSRPTPTPRSIYCSLDKIGGRMVVSSAVSSRHAQILTAKSRSIRKAPEDRALLAATR
jgi:hypothetical protein